jgi:hypothetical protein
MKHLVRRTSLEATVPKKYDLPLRELNNSKGEPIYFPFPGIYFDSFFSIYILLTVVPRIGMNSIRVKQTLESKRRKIYTTLMDKASEESTLTFWKEKYQAEQQLKNAIRDEVVKK